MELVSLSCNRVFISAESVGLGWCKIAIATKWYQFHTTDKCGFLFMPWITDQYTFVQYTKLVNKKAPLWWKSVRFQLWQLSVTYTQCDMPPHPTPSENWARYFTCRIGMASLWSACAAVCRVNKWFADDAYALLKVNFFQNLTYHAKLTTSVGWNDTQASPRPFCDPRFPAQGLAGFAGKRLVSSSQVLHARWLVVIVNNGFPVDWSDSG